MAGNEKLMEENKIAYAKCESSGTVVYVSCEGMFLGAVVISDVVKEGAKEAIASMKQVGVRRTVMLTGDRSQAAQEIASEFASGR